jgi:hypothetical protein
MLHWLRDMPLAVRKRDLLVATRISFISDVRDEGEINSLDHHMHTTSSRVMREIAYEVSVKRWMTNEMNELTKAKSFHDHALAGKACVPM